MMTRAVDPERLAALLEAVGLGPLVYRERVDSTNARALALAREGAAEGAVVLAAEQTAGRGRAGARWVSPRGLGLYGTLLLLPPPGLRERPLFGLLGGVAAVRAVRRETGLAAELKWPNDVLVADRKVGGVLAEAEGPAVVVGVGLNLFHRRDQLPPRPAYPASSLRLEGWPGRDGTGLAAALLREAATLYARLVTQGPRALEAPLREVWREYGAWVEAEGGPEAGWKGRVADVNLEAGRLLLAVRGGRSRSLSLTGFVRLRRREKSEPTGAGEV